MRSVRDRNLQAPFRSWIDRRLPLPEQVLLFPRTLSLGYDLLSCLILGGVFGGMGVAILMISKPWELDPADAGWAPFVFIGAICLGLWLVPLLLIRRTWITFCATLDQRRGKLRQGVFLGPEGLLVRMEPNRCHAIAWNKFLTATRYSALNDEHDSSAEIQIVTRDGTVAFFDRNVSTTADEICRYVPQFIPGWKKPKRIERRDRKKQTDTRMSNQVQRAALYFAGSMIGIGASLAAVIVGGKDSAAADIGSVVLLVSLVAVFASVVNIFYRYGKLRWFYRCPQCRQRLKRIDQARPDINYYCPTCNVEWMTGWKEVEGGGD